MKKIFLSIFISIVSILSIFVMPKIVMAQNVTTTGEGQIDKIDYVLFHLETCPHCRDEIKFLDKKLMPQYGEYINLQMYEVSTPENQKIFEQYGMFYNVQVGAVPLAFIDDEQVFGYQGDKTTGKQITDIVERKLKEKGILQNISNGESSTSTTSTTENIRLPLLGTLDARSISLPFLTVVLGLLDGFNPCAMWVLIFLITLLLGMKDKKRMWLLGSIFVVTSGAVYFIFMAAWLQFLLFIGMITIVRMIIGLVAVGVGGFQLKNWWKNRKADGVVCEVSNKKSTKNTFEKIKNIVHKESLWLSVAGIILLGFSVNLVELACSAGFPAIFTQVLALNDIAMWQRYLYMFGYIVFYMLDDIVVFVIAMLTLQSKTIGGKYAKYANLVGGLIIFILGFLLIFKPTWLMFG